MSTVLADLPAAFAPPRRTFGRQPAVASPGGEVHVAETPPSRSRNPDSVKPPYRSMSRKAHLVAFVVAFAACIMWLFGVLALFEMPSRKAATAATSTTRHAAPDARTPAGGRRASQRFTAARPAPSASVPR